MRAALRDSMLVLRGAFSIKMSFADIKDLRPSVFGLSFVHADALYRLRMTPGEAIDWAARIERTGHE